MKTPKPLSRIYQGICNGLAWLAPPPKPRAAPEGNPSIGVARKLRAAYDEFIQVNDEAEPEQMKLEGPGKEQTA